MKRLQIFTDDLDKVLPSGHMLGLGVPIAVTCPGRPSGSGFYVSHHMDQDNKRGR